MSDKYAEAIHYLQPIADSASDKMSYGAMLNLALTALRDQQERSEGCDCCLLGEELATSRDSMKRNAYIYLDGNLLTADLYSESMAVAVCYCPVCGRPLTATPKEDKP